MTPQQRQAARRAAKLAHGSRQIAIVEDPGPVNIYVWPAWVTNEGYWTLGGESKLIDSPAAYTSVHLSSNGASAVFSTAVNGYNQIFTVAVPPVGQSAGTPLQLTTDLEQHWVPHISADGSKVVFTKSDPNSSGDVVCVIDNAAGATENCLDFSSATLVLKGAALWHASWTPDGKIVFEAWGDPLNSDEIFMVNADGSALTQITNNAGTHNYDECPAVSGDGKQMLVDTWNDTTHYFEVTRIDLSTKQRLTLTPGTYTHGDSWDPLYMKYSLVWVSSLPGDQSLELYMKSFSPIHITNNIYADYFESGYLEAGGK
jgi:Tol biopolymer transport system component